MICTDKRGLAFFLSYQRGSVSLTHSYLLCSLSSSLSIVCHNEKAAKRNALKSDFVVSASSLENKAKKSRKIYTEDVSHDGKPSNRRNARLKSSGGVLPLLRSPQLKAMPNMTTVAGMPPNTPLSLSPNKIHPMQENNDPCTVDVQSVPIVTNCKSPHYDNGRSGPELKHDNNTNNKSLALLSGDILNDPAGQMPTANKLEGKHLPFRRSLQPINLTGSVGPQKKNKKLPKSDAKKRRSGSNPDDMTDNIDSRIEMELSQSSSESNPHIETKNQDIVTNAKVEEAKSAKGDFHQKMKLDSIANKRKERKHQVDLKTMNPAEIAAKNKRRSSIMFSFKSSKEGSFSSSSKNLLSKKFKRTSSFFRSGRQLSVSIASQAKAALDIHGLGQRANLHDCIQSYLADEVVKSWECGSCAGVSDVTRKKRIANAPEVLVFYFRRFIKNGFFQAKENMLVSFPLENLDLCDFCDMTSSNYFKGGWDQKATYDLQVLVRHVGKNKDSNHYSTMARHDPEGKWFEYHDHRVRVVSKRYVASKEALMLFYVRRKPYYGLTASPECAMVNELQASVRIAVLQRREALVDEINYRKYLI